MFTDVVGYTSLTQKNEALALKLLQDHERLLRPIFRKHNGREVKTIGDSFLVEFASALEAVECANEVQNSMRELNSTLKPEGRILLRIGIHVGDVVHSRGDVYGDAVNVASRLESLAEPGCICISQQVYDHVRDKSDVAAVYIGKQLLKNVDLPVDTYRVVLPWEEKPPPVTPATSSHRVAILPLVNISPDPNDEYFSDGMTEELISAVSKVGDLRVISRTSVMKYKGAGKTVGEIARELNVGAVLEGSVRKAGARLRITMQLIDVRNDEHLWSQSYDRNLDDVFEIQSDIAKRVAEALEVHLLAKDRQRIEKKATESIEAYTIYLKGLHYRGERTEEGLRKAIRYFEEALLKDSRFALAYQGMADWTAALAGGLVWLATRFSSISADWRKTAFFHPTKVSPRRRYSRRRLSSWTPRWQRPTQPSGPSSRTTTGISPPPKRSSSLPSLRTQTTARSATRTVLTWLALVGWMRQSGR